MALISATQPVKEVAMRRLNSRVQFQAVTARPPTCQTAHFALHRAETHRVPGLSSGPAIGVLLPKRWAKRAVTRNGMRRQIYAVFNQVLPVSATWTPRDAALVIRLRRSFLREEFVSAWSKPLARAVRAELQQLRNSQLIERES